MANYISKITIKNTTYDIYDFIRDDLNTLYYNVSGIRTALQNLKNRLLTLSDTLSGLETRLNNL